MRGNPRRILLAVSNSVVESVMAGNPALCTTKEDAKEHGFGLKTVREIADRNNGGAFHNPDLEAEYTHSVHLEAWLKWIAGSVWG